MIQTFCDTISFIQSFNKYLLSAYYVLCYVLEAGDAKINKMRYLKAAADYKGKWLLFFHHLVSPLKSFLPNDPKPFLLTPSLLIISMTSHFSSSLSYHSQCSLPASPLSNF